ncbi:MAG TPA: hypothetical protein VJM11_02255, partial [Nevskiaceae bacterium]|nr:hypothetical protein [Nevskiaceae bacterium]
RGDTFQVNTYTEGRQYLPRVAMDARGDFVVAWQSYGQEDGDTGNIGVYARGYRANGDPVGRPFRVNQSTNLDQRSASVALDADGDVVVVWSSEAVTHPSDALVRRFEGFSSVDLSLKQVDTPDPVQAGETLTVTLRASNLDAAATPMGYDAIDRAIDAASNVRIVSQLPAGATNVTAAGNNWACTVAGGVVDCDYKRLLRATDQSSVLTLQMTAPSTPEPTISTFSKVRADQPDPAPANNRETDATAVNN